MKYQTKIEHGAQAREISTIGNLVYMVQQREVRLRYFKRVHLRSVRMSKLRHDLTIRGTKVEISATHTTTLIAVKVDCFAPAVSNSAN